MAPRDGLRPQIDFPQLIADVIRDLNVRGPLGVLNLSDEVRPVFIIGARGLTVTSNAIAFTSADINFGDVTSPVAGTVVVDTGPLAAGTYDCLLQFSANMTIGGVSPIRAEHRNAANSATLATLASLLMVSGVPSDGQVWTPLFGYEIALNERLRLVSPAFNSTGGGMAGSIWAHRRVVP